MQKKENKTMKFVALMAKYQETWFTFLRRDIAGEQTFKLCNIEKMCSKFSLTIKNGKDLWEKKAQNDFYFCNKL